MSACNQPLTCEITDDERVVVSIGVETLAFALQHGWEYFGHEHANVRITSGGKFAEDIKRALLHEDEQGNTLLTELLENAADKAINSGSAFVEVRK